MTPLPERKRYTVPWGLRFVYGIAALGTGFVAIRALYTLVQSPPQFTGGEMGATLLLLLFVGAMGYLCFVGADRSTAAITFTEEGVGYRSLVRKRYLKYEDIAGFQAWLPAEIKGSFFVRERIVIVPNSFRTKSKHITIQPDMGGHAEIFSWLTANFKRFGGRKWVDR